MPDNATPQLLDVGEHFTGPAANVTPDGRTVIYSIAQGRRTATMDYNAGNAHSFGAPLRVWLRPDGKLGYEPISELQTLRGTQLVNITTDTTYASANTTLASAVNSDTLEIEAEIAPGSANEVGISLRRSPNAEEETIIYYKISSKEFFGKPHQLQLESGRGKMVPWRCSRYRLREYQASDRTVDRSLVEGYLNGLKSLTTRAYPTRSDAKGVRIWANANTNTVTVKTLKVWAMNSAYPTVNPTGVTVPASKSIINGDSQLIVPIVEPANASNKDVIWTSSNNAVASVVNGVVTAKSVGTATITAKTRVGNFTGNTAVTVTAEPAHGELINHEFDDNLSGWTILSGDAFSMFDVTKDNDWGWGGPLNQSGSYHLWGAKNGDDSQTGSIRSQKFILGGNGQIDFLLGGGNDYYGLYVALVRSFGRQGAVQSDRRRQRSLLPYLLGCGRLYRTAAVH